jgi:hypothetical protein
VRWQRLLASAARIRIITDAMSDLGEARGFAFTRLLPHSSSGNNHHD